MPTRHRDPAARPPSPSGNRSIIGGPGVAGAWMDGSRSVRHRIAATGREGMAAQQPPQRQPAPAPGAMTLDRLEAIGAATGNEAAAGPQQRRDPAPIELNQQQQQGRHRALPPGEGCGCGCRGCSGAGGKAEPLRPDRQRLRPAGGVRSSQGTWLRALAACRPCELVRWFRCESCGCRPPGLLTACLLSRGHVCSVSGRRMCGAGGRRAGQRPCVGPSSLSWERSGVGDQEPARLEV